MTLIAGLHLTPRLRFELAYQLTVRHSLNADVQAGWATVILISRAGNKEVPSDPMMTRAIANSNELPWPLPAQQCQRQAHLCHCSRALQLASMQTQPLHGTGKGGPCSLKWPCNALLWWSAAGTHQGGAGRRLSAGLRRLATACVCSIAAAAAS